MSEPPMPTGTRWSPRLATSADARSVEAIVKDAYAEYVPIIGREPGPMQDDYAALIARRRVHVVELDGGIAGLVVLIPVDGALLLDNVAVARSVQGRGVGAALLAHAERTAEELGYGEIRLYTNQAMTRNIAIYARRGYVETHRAVQDGLARVFMTKRLGRADEGRAL